MYLDYYGLAIAMKVVKIHENNINKHQNVLR